MKWIIYFWYILLSCSIAKGQSKSDRPVLLEMAFSDKKFSHFYNYRTIYLLENGDVRKEDTAAKVRKRRVKIIANKDTLHLSNYLWISEVLILKNSGRIMMTNMKTRVDFNVSFVKESGRWKIRESVLMSDD